MWPLFILVTSALCLCPVSGRQWVDPHDMDFKQHEANNLKASSEKIMNECVKTTPTECHSDKYLKRLIRLIITNAYLDNDGGDTHMGHLNIQLTTKELDLLRYFTKNNDPAMTLHRYVEVQSVFETAIQKTSFSQYKEMAISLQDELYYMIFNPTTAILGGSCLIMILIYKLLRAQFSCRNIIRYIGMVGYVLDFAFTFLKIQREEEIANLVTLKSLGSVPPECDSRKMNWLQFTRFSLKSMFFENECKSYYEATHQPSMNFVAPTKVLSYQFKQLVVDPFEHMGEAFGKFGGSMFRNLPLGLNLLLFPILLITICFLTIILLVFVTRTGVRFSLFHLFTIDLNNRPRIQERADEARPQIVHHHHHREMVEEVEQNLNLGQIQGGGDGRQEQIVVERAEQNNRLGNDQCPETQDRGTQMENNETGTEDEPNHSDDDSNT